MKSTTILSLTAASIATLIFTSCGTSDPEYKAWKEQQNTQQAGNNRYGVPQAGGEPGTHTPSGGTAPYQPLPGVNRAPSHQPPLASDVAANIPTLPATGGIAYTVVAGDSLWALAKKHNTTLEVIQAANNMTDSNIRAGQKLTLPAQ
jgi:LysM repeat protein